MDVSKCTPGKVHAEGLLGSPNRFLIYSIAEDCDIADVYLGRNMPGGKEGGEPGANAKLVEEAFNVAAETGRSPIELADWQAQAATVLIRMVEWLTDNLDCQCGRGHVCSGCTLLDDMQVLLRDAGAI